MSVNYVAPGGVPQHCKQNRASHLLERVPGSLGKFQRQFPRDRLDAHSQDGCLQTVLIEDSQDVRLIQWPEFQLSSRSYFLVSMS